MTAIWSKNKKGRRLSDILKDKQEDPFVIKEGNFRFGSLKDPFHHTDWTEESFLADSSRKTIISRTFDFRYLRYFVAFFLVAISVIIVRAAWLQLIKHDYYRLQAEDNRLRAETIEPKRGIIYSRDLQPLVRNKANFVLYVRPIDLPDDELARDDLLREISGVLEGQDPAANQTASAVSLDSSSASSSIQLIADNLSFYSLKEKIATVKIGSLESYQPFFIADNIDYDKAMLITLKLRNWPGVFLSNKIRREYLSGSSSTSSPEVLEESSLAHILGYTGKINEQEMKELGDEYSPIDYIGKMGVEYSWEKELKGTSGRKNIEVDALGRQKKVINEIPAVDGANLQLSIDLGLQQKAESVVKAYLKNAGLKRAAVIIMDPNNGEILALVSLPTYNNNLFASGISQTDYSRLISDPDKPLFNRSISGEFPSGSVIKPIFAAAALEEKVITENTSFVSTGGVRIGEWFFPDWKAGGHGVTDVRSALAFSVNTFFYYIGGGFGDFKGLGLSGLVKYSYLFGLGEKTNIDLPGEGTGFVPTKEWKEKTKNEPWYIGDTYHFSIGQGDVIVTPLQVANYTAAIANGGTLFRPHVVSKILGEDVQVIGEIEPEVIRRDFISPSNLQIVREGMRQTVTIGSARSMSVLPVEVAGKTGTAQWSTKNSPHAWFTGFAPYNNPTVVITVLVEEGVEESTIAVPIAKDILAWYFSSH